MSGPIVRTGTTPEFWKNWDRVFGDKSKKKTASKTATRAAGKKTAKSAKGKSGKKKKKK